MKALTFSAGLVELLVHTATASGGTGVTGVASGGGGVSLDLVDDFLEVLLDALMDIRASSKTRTLILSMLIVLRWSSRKLVCVR